MAPGGVAHEQLRVQVEAQLRVPVRRVGVGEGTHVDQPDDVRDPREPAQHVVGLVHGGGGACLRGDVGDDRVSVDLGGDAPRSLGVDIGDRDARAGSGEQQRGQPSAAVAAADDERRLVLETEEFLHYFPSCSREPGGHSWPTAIVIEDRGSRRAPRGARRG